MSKAPGAESTITKKGGKGTTHGVVSELSAFITVKPGQTEQLRAALDRFHERVRNAPLSAIQQVGIQDLRQVIFDNGTRMAWMTSFDTEWDPYIDDAIALIGIDAWNDWLKHTVEYDGVAQDNASIKRYLQSAQEPAVFTRTIPSLTIGQIRKREELANAFEQVLEQPAALEALRHPALKPLLDLASA
jgi:hypothetical protein